MHDLVKKVGSLVLGASALSLLLVNAALTHGCSGATRDAPATQAGAPPPATPQQPRGSEQPPGAAPVTAAAPTPPASADASASAGEDDCEEDAPYMHATKAPVMPMRRCGKKSTPNAKQTTQPSSPSNAQQQAP
jgi:hypothetical protein